MVAMKFKKWLESKDYEDYKKVKEKHDSSMADYEKEYEKYRSLRRDIDKDFAMRVYKAANAAWDAGKDVYFNTMTQMVKITPKNRAAIRLNGRDLQVARGRSWDSLAGQGINSMAHYLNVSPPDYTGIEAPDKPEAPNEPFAHKLTPEEYMDIRGGRGLGIDFWRDAHKQAVQDELDAGLVPPV